MQAWYSGLQARATRLAATLVSAFVVFRTSAMIAVACWPISDASPTTPAAPAASALAQRRMAEVLESREAHYMVIGLVLLDLAIVLAELVLSSFYPTPELAPHLGAWPAGRLLAVNVVACIRLERMWAAFM